MKMELAWHLADITNGLMVIPNLIALIGLSGVIVAENRKFLDLVKKEQQDEVDMNMHKAMNIKP